MLKTEILKFIIVGVINTLFYFLIYSLFIYFSLDYKIAVLLATIIGIIFSFKTFSLYVFNSKNNKLFFKFLLLYIILYIINISIIYLLNNLIYENYYLTGFIASFILAILTYLGNKFLIFKKESIHD